jgi:ribonuclease BN (tRNA processing enzyme)
MKFQLLPSTFDENGCASPKQHLACFVIDNCVAIDAGSLAMAAGSVQKEQIRDIVLTHAHLDHIAGLPLFIDDLFASLTEPIRVHATNEVVEILERDVFNWDVYPRFSELKNEFGTVLEYHPFEIGEKFSIRHLNFKSVSVNHKVPAVGFIVSDREKTFALSGDTAGMNEFWETVNGEEDLNAILIECAFPNELKSIANDSHHLTPDTLKKEIAKSRHKNTPIFIINLKPMYRDEIIRQIVELKIENLQILEVGKIYNW